MQLSKHLNGSRKIWERVQNLIYHQTRGNYLSHLSVIICHGYRGNLKPRTATQQGQRKPQISVLRSWKEDS